MKTSKVGAIQAKANPHAYLRQIFVKISEGLLNKIAYQVKVHRFPMAYYMCDLDEKLVLKISARLNAP